MSEKSVEASRRLWDRFMAGDMESVLASLDAGVEVRDMPEMPDASVYHGHAGWLAQIAKFREAFDEMDYRVLEHIDCGDQVVTVIEAAATGTGSGITGVGTYAEVETWRDGRVTSIAYFLSKEAALEAAGPRD